ncbi:MAG: ABC transporter permease [Planctomycetes bacterium]|nr:ABC transporter permease [Planctomycetota bacterium]
MLPFEYAVRNLGRSPRRLAASVLGSALVVLLILAGGAFVMGMSRSLSPHTSRDNVMLLGAGSEESVERSEIMAGVDGLATGAISGLRSRLGAAYVSPECHMAVVMKPDRDSGQELAANIRGVTPSAFLVHSQVQIVEGRAPELGRDEIMVGALAAARLGVSQTRLTVGQQLWFDNRNWKIVGRFEAPGTVMAAEIWMPLEDLKIATRRTTISTVIVTLGDGEFADVSAFAKQRLDLELVAQRESDYYAKLMNFYGPIRILVWVTAGLIALGGLFGGLNTMYAAFASRVRELGTLQTLGYSRPAIVLSLVQESVLATTVGAIIAIVLGLLFLDGAAVRISMGAFGLTVDAAVVTIALLSGIALGVLGALPPAWRCLRMEIPQALRAQ